jgi:acyl-homoserine lactone acylase PvdQ
MRKVLGVLVGVLLLAVPATASATTDFAGSAFNILAPGESGGLPADANSTDQAKLYDALTPLRGDVTASDVAKYYKSEKFGAEGSGQRTEVTGHPGVTIVRDSFNVPHVNGQTRADVFWGAGWVAIEDRGLLMNEGRGPSRVAMLDVPGVNAFGLVTQLRSFTPTKQANDFVHQQVVDLGKTAKGRQVVTDFTSWVAGVNAYETAHGAPANWTVDDAMAGFAFIGSIFGNGGGGEVANGEFLANLQKKYGTARGLRIFRDLRQVNDPEAPTTVKGPFPYEAQPKGRTPGAVIPDPGSETSSATRADVAARASHHLASNALLVGADRSTTGHPLAVMGPQLGYYYPEIFMEYDLHGGGIDVRGGAPPVQPYVLIGRAKDYAWSLTSADSDNRDQFLEKLCEPGGKKPTRASHHYVYKGKCKAMGFVDAGKLGAGGGQPAKELTFWQTVHGPVSGTVTVKGKPYAVSTERATRGRDPQSAIALSDLNANKVTSPKSFFKVANEFETTFNWHYVDSKHIAYFSSGRLPVRAKGTDPSLPTLGTGKYDWKGYLTQNQHPHGADPKSGTILNWNNKPAKSWGANDSNYNFGSFFRVQAFTFAKRKNTLADVVSVMNRAASQDLRARFIWPTVEQMLKKGKAPTPLAQQAVGLIDAWRAKGEDRLDRNLDGKIDDPGAAILDAIWPGVGDDVLGPVLSGKLLAQFKSVANPDDTPSNHGSSFDGGWYGYISKDLRTQLGKKVKGKYSVRFCGKGSVKKCSASLWKTIQAATDKLAAAQGSNPTAWRADATKERITFAPGLISDTMRWTNRPTFQQAISFSGHR